MDVSGAVSGNGQVTFALTQENWNTRIYLASRENTKTAIRPSLVVTYQRGSRPPTRPPATTAPPTTAAPTPTPTRTVAPSPTRTVSPPAPTTVAPRPTPTVRPGTDVPGWRLVWSDEFTGPTVDLKRWNLRDNEGRDIDRGCNVDDADNTFVADGVLTLRAQRENAVCSSQTRQYTQSYLDTNGKASFTYGAFETRAKSPNGPSTSTGLWPAFWMRPNDGGKGEIDVTELPGGRPITAPPPRRSSTTTPRSNRTIGTFASGYPGDGFHAYRTEWEPGVLRWYIDGSAGLPPRPQYDAVV